MIEAYAIGVNLSLRGNIGAEIGRVASQFEQLNRIITQSKTSVNELASGIRGLTRLGRGAADAWKDAAAAMERAARATRDAYRAASAAPAPPAAPQAPSGGGAPSTMLRQPRAPRAPLLLTYQPVNGFTMWNDPALPTGGGSVPRLGPPVPPGFQANPAPRFGPLVPLAPGGAFPGGPGSGTVQPFTQAGGTFAGGPGTPGGALVPGGAGGGGRGPIPLASFRLPGMPNAPGAHDFAMGALGFGAVGDMLLSTVSAAFQANKEVYDRLSVMGNAGFSADQLKDAQLLARQTQQGVPGITQGQALHIMHDLFTITQNAHEAIDPRLVADYAKAGIVLESLGKSDAIAELFKAMQSGELRGSFVNDHGEVDARKAKDFLDNVLATTNMTGGRIGPAEILQVLKSSGLATGMMDDKTLFAQMVAPALSMGPANAGRGMQAFASQFVAGKMSDAAVKLMLRMKLIENLPANAGSTPGQQFEFLKPLYKTGIGQWALPLNMMPYRNDPNLNPAEHPIDFMQRVLVPAMDAYNEKTNGAPRDEKDKMVQRMALALALASRIPAGNVEGDVIRNAPLIARDEAALRSGLERGGNDGFFNHLQETNPSVRMAAFEASMNGLLLALGGPAMDSAMKGMRDLTAFFNSMNDFATAHPDLSKGLMEYGFKFGVLAVGLSTLSAAFAVLPSMVRIVGFAWSLLSFGTALSGLPMTTLAALPGAMTAFGVAAVALRASLLAGVGVGLIQAGKNALFPGLDMHKWMLENVPGAQFLNRMMNRATGGHVGDSNEDMDRQYPGLRGKPNAPDRPPITPDNPFFRKMNYAPPVKLDQKIELHVEGTIDGRTLLSFVKQAIIREGSAPSGGTTGPDLRVSTFGGMSGAGVLA